MGKNKIPRQKKKNTKKTQLFPQWLTQPAKWLMMSPVFGPNKQQRNVEKERKKKTNPKLCAAVDNEPG